MTIASHRAKAEMISWGSYNYVDSDPGEAVPTDDEIVADAWGRVCQKEKVQIALRTAHHKYVSRF